MNADSEQRMAGRGRPGVSSYNRFFSIPEPLDFNDAMKTIILSDWPCA